MGLLGGIESFGKGVWDSTAGAAIQVVTHPVETVQGVANLAKSAVTDPMGTAKQLEHFAGDVWEKAKQDPAYAAGFALGTVGPALLTGGGSAAVEAGVETANVGVRLGEVGNAATKLGEVGRGLEAANTLSKGAGAASAVGKAADVTEAASAVGKGAKVTEAAGAVGKGAEATSAAGKGAEATGAAGAAGRTAEAAEGSEAAKAAGVGAVVPSVRAPNGVREVAKAVHAAAAPEGQAIADSRAVQMSAVAVVKAKLADGTTAFYASGNGAVLSPRQVSMLEKAGVPSENILKGAKYKVTDSLLDRKANNLLNHAERIIDRNLPKGAQVEEWGISWTTPQKPVPCKTCAPVVAARGGEIKQ